MKKIQRIMAWIGIICLAGLYLSTIVLALIGTETSLKLLQASILCTIGFPVLLYAYRLIYKVLNDRNESRENESDAEASSISRKASVLKGSKKDES